MLKIGLHSQKLWQKIGSSLCLLTRCKRNTILAVALLTRLLWIARQISAVGLDASPVMLGVQGVQGRPKHPGFRSAYASSLITLFNGVQFRSVQSVRCERSFSSQNTQTDSPGDSIRLGPTVRGPIQYCAALLVTYAVFVSHQLTSSDLISVDHIGCSHGELDRFDPIRRGYDQSQQTRFTWKLVKWGKMRWDEW